MNCQSKQDMRIVRLAFIPAALIFLVLSVIFIGFQTQNKPVSRDEAVFCQGYFEDYQIHKTPRRTGNCWIDLSDGTRCFVYAHTRTTEFHDSMEAMEKGTELSLAIHPESHYVIEVKTADREILHFEESQRAIARHSNSYVVLGLLMGIFGAVCLWYVLFSLIYERNERKKARRKEIYAQNHPDENTPCLRPAGEGNKCRVFVRDKIDGYCISYRRRRIVNELVINGYVYDQKKGLFEFAHNLSVTLDGHLIEAGLDEGGISYLHYDGKRRKRKKRSR